MSRSRLLDDPLRRSTAWLNTGVRLIGAGLSFVLFIVLARVMSPESFASVVLTLAWLALVTAVAGVSMPAVVVRFLAERRVQGRYEQARGIMVFAVTATLGLSGFLSLSWFALLATNWFDLPLELQTITKIGALLLPPGVLLLVLAGVLQGLKRVVAAELLTNTIRPLLMLNGLAAFALIYGLPLTAPQALTIYLVTMLLIVLACSVYTFSVLPRELRSAKSSFEPRAWWSSALGFFGVMIAAAINERIDVLMMGFVAPAGEVAVYALGSRFVQPVLIVATAATAVMAPHLVERLADLRNHQHDVLLPLVRHTARTIMIVSILALAGLWLLAPLFLPFFGEHYLPAVRPMLILAGGQVIASFFGPAAAVAAFSGNARIATISLLCGIVVNATLNLALVPHLGASGAAFATASGYVAAATMAWYWLMRTCGLNTGAIGRCVRS